MIRLLGVEALRLRSRRFVRLGILFALVLIAVSASIAAIVSGPDDDFSLVLFVDAMPGIGPMFLIAGLAVGATFVGADWSAGTISTQLTWEPRRVRVVVAKVAVVAVGVFVLSVVLELILVGAFALVAMARGTTVGVDEDWMRGVVEVTTRTGVLASIAGVMGLAIALVSRVTAAALGIAFAWFAVAEGLIRGLKPSLQPWLIGDNAAIVLIGENADVIVGSSRGPLRALLQLTVYAVVAAALACVWFSRRDVN